MDGEILISLKAKHTPTTDLTALLRRALPHKFPQLQFFFQPADIVDQVLNFGQPAPIDIRISGPNMDEAYVLASKLARDIKQIGGVVDSHVFQVPDAPSIGINVDRSLAADLGLDQRSTAANLLVSTNGSAQTTPNFWIDPENNVSYPLVVQMPTYAMNSLHDLWTMPISSAQERAKPQLMMNVAKFKRSVISMAMSQVNIRPVFDVDADVQGRDLASVANDIAAVIAKDHRPLRRHYHRTAHRYR